MTINFVRTSRSETETALIAAALGRVLRAGDALLLDGPLGAGKTTLVREVASAMKVDARAVASPTFVLMHEYPGVEGGPGLIHVDAYRLRGDEELETIGWDTVSDRIQVRPSAVLIVEWAERLTEIPGDSHASVRMDHVDPSTRELAFSLPNSWRGRPGLSELTGREATRCPMTGQRVEADSPWYPFASERAKMADLNRWFTGTYNISRDATDADFDAS